MTGWPFATNPSLLMVVRRARHRGWEKVLFRLPADVWICPSQMKKTSNSPQIPPPVVINKSKRYPGTRA